MALFRPPGTVLPMGRLWRDSARITIITAGLVSLTALSAGCAAVDAEPEARPKSSTASASNRATVAYEAKLQACYADAKAHDPELSVHTVALFFARDGKLVFVDVELPKTPQLAGCLSDAILRSNVFEAPIAQEAGAVAAGALRIDLGPPLTVPVPRPTLAEVRARDRRVTLAALQQGALRESDPMVRELLNPPPPWPTPEMQAELAACHTDSLKTHPGLVLHRDVIYLTRAGKVLLADVSIPEDLQLRRCVLARIHSWSAPLLGSSEETTLSGFFMSLGAPEALPEPPRSLTAELDRRKSLLQRALELDLIKEDDPVLKRFESHGPSRSSDPPANEALGGR